MESQTPESPYGHRSRSATSSRAKVSRQQPGLPRSRGLTCTKCRARKVRCDGAQPACKTCELYHDECRYEKPPPMSQLLAMAKRLQEAEKTIEDLRAGLIPSSGEDSSTHADASRHTEHAPPPGTSSVSTQDLQTPRISLPTTNDAVSWDETTSIASPIGHSTPTQPAPTELTADEHGNIRYYGPTSAVHDPPQTNLPVSPECIVHSGAPSQAEMRSSLAVHARETAIWEEFALQNASLHTGIPRQIIARLLHIHWTWVSPMFLWVYRNAFIRDMATGGRHYSEFLLTVLCAHAAKYQDGDCADSLLTRARTLLGTAVQQPSSIPTVQALLQLSALDLAKGSISQAWVYSGIAFRMASDLGLQHSNSIIKGLSHVDLEIRRRLFWSCYFWDKATSLYAGRLPSVTEALDPSSLNLLDDSADLDIWSPYFGDSVNLTKLSHTQYPPTNSYVVSAFINSCKLSIIINDIIIRLYYRRSKAVTESSFKDIKLRLDLWRAQSPPHLKFDPDNLPSICPPPHLISQNLLYFASIILAHRPFWSAPIYYQACIQASRSIEKLVLLLDSTFGLENITYLMGYCIYTGASAILEDAKKGNDSAYATLQTFIRALNSGMRRCRLLERSLNIIIKEMSHSPAPDEGTSMNGVSHSESDAATMGFIPAFPYVNPSVAMNFDVNSYFGQEDMASYPMSVLDCYPEMQMDLGGTFGTLG